MMERLARLPVGGMLMDTNLNAVISRAPSRWRDQFRRFVEGVEEDEGFLVALNSDTSLQRLVDEAFSLQARSFERLVAVLAAAGRKEERQVATPAQMAEAIAANVREAAETVSALPPAERDAVVRQASASLSPSAKQVLRVAINGGSSETEPG
jgi:hypothetical protein